jgi:NAD(P)-dependent dehydrogenase (short-subunit alcohol dehydrogenase family)
VGWVWHLQRLCWNQERTSLVLISHHSPAINHPGVGVHVRILQSRRSQLAGLALNVAERNSRRLTYHQVDVSNQKMHAEVLETVLATVRYPLRGAVCCAGITQEIPAIEYPPAEFQKILNVNTIGVFITAQLAARAFLRQRVSGSIVLIASMSGSIANRVSLLFDLHKDVWSNFNVSGSVVRCL